MTETTLFFEFLFVIFLHCYWLIYIYLKLIEDVDSTSSSFFIILPQKFDFIIVVIEQPAKIQLIIVLHLELNRMRLISTLLLEHHLALIWLITHHNCVVLRVMEGCHHVVLRTVNRWPRTYHFRNMYLHSNWSYILHDPKLNNWTGSYYSELYFCSTPPQPTSYYDFLLFWSGQLSPCSPSTGWMAITTRSDNYKPMWIWWCCLKLLLPPGALIRCWIWIKFWDRKCWDYQQFSEGKPWKYSWFFR